MVTRVVSGGRRREEIVRAAPRMDRGVTAAVRYMRRCHVRVGRVASDMWQERLRRASRHHGRSPASTVETNGQSGRVPFSRRRENGTMRSMPRGRA